MEEKASAQWLRVGEAARFLGVHGQTVRAYERSGKLPARRFGVRQERRFRREDLLRLVRAGAEPRAALYVRVSGSTGQETSLSAQELELRGACGSETVVVFSDRASGLNERRRGLARLREAAARGEVDEVWVTHEDRLTRFGVSFLRAELASHGVCTHVLHEREDATVEQELMDDFMSLLASFSGRVYGQRSAAARKRLLAAAESKAG